MTTASYQQIVDLLGEVDPLFVRRIEGTRASLEEINEALGQLEEDRYGQERHAASSPRVTEVRTILEEIYDEPEADEEAWSPAGTM